MSASGVFWRLVQGIADVDPVLLPQAATRAVQRAGAGPVSADEAHGEDDLALAEVHMPESQAFVDSELAAFEARIGQRQPQQQPQQQPPAQRAATSAVAAGLEWSSQALEYMTLLQQDKRCLRHPEYWQRGFQADFFKHVSLVRQGIRDMDAGLLELRGLRELNLSMNSVRVLEHVPRDLCVLHVYGNEMQAVAHGTRCPSLVHLGAGCNRLADAAALCSRFPALVSLDLSYNSLCDLLGTLASLSRLPALRQLWLAGNPLSLLPAYRERVVRSLPQLEHLDDVALRDEDGQAAIPAPLAPHRERDGGYDSLCSVVVHVDSVRNAPPPAAEEPVQAPAEAAPPVPVGRKSASKRGGRAVDSTPEPSAAHAIAAERAVRYYVQLEVPRAAGDAPRSAEVPYAATMEFGWASRHEMPADVRTRDLLLCTFARWSCACAAACLTHAPRPVRSLAQWTACRWHCSSSHPLYLRPQLRRRLRLPPLPPIRLAASARR